MRPGASVGALLLLLLSPAGAAVAQGDTGDKPIRDLPRPGYEPQRIRFGQTILSPELVTGVEYDTNVFATSTNPDDDVLLTWSPSLGIDRDDGKLKLDADLFATLRHYFDNETEDVNTFGFTGNTRYAITNAHLLSATFGAERSYQRRSDPEAEIDPLRTPAKINIGRAELGYQYRPNRIGLGVRAAVERVNYLPSEDADRDIDTFRASARATMRATSRFDAFVEGFVNKRDARTAVDRNGVDRDALTKGVLAGLAVDVANRLQGEVGLGLFHTNPEDPTLKSFSGFAASGSLLWRPRIRTAVTAEIFRGDVATIRAGASGRIDTRASLRLDQEVRHNLLLSGSLAVRDTSYRGSTRSLTVYTGELESTYLVNRHLAISAGATFAKRSANVPTDRFERARFLVSTRLIY